MSNPLLQTHRKTLIPNPAFNTAGKLPRLSARDSTPAVTMGLAYNVYLTSNKIFGCKQCKTHLADYNDIISRVSYMPFFRCCPALSFSFQMLTPQPPPIRIFEASTAKPTSSTPSST